MFLGKKQKFLVLNVGLRKHDTTQFAVISHSAKTLKSANFMFGPAGISLPLCDNHCVSSKQD